MCSSALIYLSPRRATLLLPEHNSWSIPQTASSFVQPGFFFSTSSSLAIKACLLFLNLLTNKKIIPFALLLLLLLLLLISINSYSYTGLYFMSGKTHSAYHQRDSILGLGQCLGRSCVWGGGRYH